MKNSITQVSLFVIAFVALSLLMSYTRPAAEEPKQYMIVKMNGGIAGMEKEVNDKLAEGWHLQGGITGWGGGAFQALVK